MPMTAFSLYYIRYLLYILYDILFYVVPLKETLKVRKICSAFLLGFSLQTDIFVKFGMISEHPHPPDTLHHRP